MKPELVPILPQIKKLLDEFVTGDVDREKTYQFAEARKNELYWRGKQYVYPVLLDQQIADWSPVSGTMKYQKPELAGRYDYVINQIRGDGRKFISVLGQRAPNVKALPDRLDDEDAARVARQIDDILSELRVRWRVERIQRKLALSLWKDGTTFGYTPFVSDGRRHGFAEEPLIQSVDQPMGEAMYKCVQCGAETPESQIGEINELTGGMSCPQCGAPLGPEDLMPAETAPVPQVQEIVKYPKGKTELHLANIFKITTPFYSDDLDSLPWLWYEYEEHHSTVLSAYSDGRHEHAVNILKTMLDKDINSAGDGSGGLSAQGRLARDVATSPTGTYVAPRKHRWLYSRYWLLPAMYAMVPDELRQALEQNFPEGVKITSVENEIIDLESEKLSDVWAVCYPEPGESMYPDPIAKDYMGIQDLVNDVHNILVETMERAIPFTLFDPQVLNINQLRKHANAPGEFVPAVAGVGKRLQDSMWTSPKPEMNDQIMGWGDGLINKAREIVGILPALFGGEGPSQTAYEASRKLNQALMQLSPVWNEMRDFWQKAYFNGVVQTIANDPEYMNISLDGWHLEIEEAIPMTWGQIRDFFSMLIEKGPAAWQMFGLNHPSNLSTVHTALGLNGWTVPSLNAQDNILTAIRELLKGAPAQTETGLQPSIPPDDFEFDPMLAVEVVREWINSEAGRLAKEETPDGYANVLAWGKAYMTLAQPPQQPGGPPPGPGGPAGPEPPPAEESAAGIPGGEPLPAGSIQSAGGPPPPPPSVAQPLAA